MENEELEMHRRAIPAAELVGADVNRKLDEQDELNIQWARQQVGDKLRLFDNAMELYVKVIHSADHIVHETEAQIAHMTLAVRAFNDLRAIYKMLSAGYYAQTFPHLRLVMECNSRMRLFLKRPEEAKPWLDGKQIWDGHVRQHFEDRAIWSELYKDLSGATHANLVAMVMHAYDSEQDDVKHLMIGGHQNLRWMRLYAKSLVGISVFTLAIVSKPYDRLLDKDWHGHFNRLLGLLPDLADTEGVE